jgi:hypothetical protein
VVTGNELMMEGYKGYGLKAILNIARFELEKKS